MNENYFNQLNAINVGEKIEKKNGLSYLSWAWAWAEVKKLFPNANYTIYEDANGNFYHTDGKTCWVKTGVTVNDVEHIEYLPVMDFRNKSIPADAVTSFDVNKAIQRSLTKAVARHGLGLYIYAGEDLPESETDKKEPPTITLEERKNNVKIKLDVLAGIKNISVDEVKKTVIDKTKADENTVDGLIKIEAMLAHWITQASDKNGK